MLLDAITRARRALTLRAALRVLGLSSARYHQWQRGLVSCSLDDRPSCPRTQPTRASAGELDEMYFDTGAHMPSQLAAERERARQQRIAFNRAWRCHACAPQERAADTPSATHDTPR